MPRRHRLQSALPWLLFGVAVAMLLAIAPHRRHGRVFWGDEGTYVAMAESLAVDADLIFDQADHDRAETGTLGESPSVILHRAGGQLYYSKPPVYPLLVAPVFLVAGRFAFWVFNVVALGLAALLAWGSLPANPQRGWKLATFFGTAAVLPYVVWSMSDVFQFALAVAAVAAAGRALRVRGINAGGSARARRWAAGAGVCLGLLAVLRLPQMVLVIAVIAAVGVAGARRLAAIMAGAAIATGLLSAAIALPTVGTVNPYTASRTSFNAAVGYPQNAADALVGEQLETKRAAHRYRWSYDARMPWSALYSLIGRHSGILFYFPLAIFLIVWGLRRSAAPVVLGVLVLWGFYLLYRPDNYFGGSTAVGNRYFVPAYGVLVAVLTWPGRRARAAPGGWKLAATTCWLIALAAGGSALASVRGLGELDPTSQSHTAAGIFRRLPYESTLRETEGQRARFWNGDYLRFVDFRAKVHADDFVVSAERGTAEVMLVTHRAGDSFRFAAEAPPGATLIIKPWLGDWTVVTEFDGRPMEILVPKGRPLVRHPMRFDLETRHAVHRLLFGAKTSGPGVKVRYMGVGG